jgi:hypothetical protein
VTNELEEVLFLDNLKLVAVEHDAGAEVYRMKVWRFRPPESNFIHDEKSARAARRR